MMMLYDFTPSLSRLVPTPPPMAGENYGDAVDNCARFQDAAALRHSSPRPGPSCKMIDRNELRCPSAPKASQLIRDPQRLQNPLELLVGEELDVDPAPVAPAGDLTRAAEVAEESRLELPEGPGLGITRGLLVRGRLRSLRRLEVLDLLLERADAQPVLRDGPGQAQALRAVVEAEEGTRMTHGQPSLDHEVPDRLFEVQQAEHVADATPALAEHVGELLMRGTEVLHDRAIGLGLFDGIQVLTLDVLQKCHLHALGFGD